MAGAHVGVSKARLQLDDESSMQLILGDEVDVLGDADGGKVAVAYRGRQGTMKRSDLGGAPLLEVYALDVGQGDATLIVTPGRKRILVDGGKAVARGRVSEAEQALVWLYRLDEATEPLVLDLVVLSHADEDHIGGLISLVHNPMVDVRRVVHSGVATFDRPAKDDQLGTVETIDGVDYLTSLHSSLDDLEVSELSTDFAAWATALGQVADLEYEAVVAGDTIDVGDPDVTIEVLGPVVEHPDGPDAPALRWLGDRAHTINGHSVVLRLTYGELKVLLPGDLNVEGSELILGRPELAANLDAHILKAPHHGSHEFLPAFLAAVNPQITTISSGEIPDHGHPRANFLGAVGKASRGPEPLLYSTALSAVFGKADLAAHQEAVDGRDPGAIPESASDEEVRAAQRQLFHKLLPGVINLRSDGNRIHAATRVATGYWWVIFWPIPLADRTDDT